MRLVDKYGTAALMKVCEKLPKFEQAADVILCTGHKSKGREWSSVRLAEDFLRGIKAGDDDTPEMSRAEKIASELAGDIPGKHDEELMLYYVAMTRGIEAVELHPKLEKKIAFLQQKNQQKDAAA